jgi:hypothetical protein
MVPTSVVLHPMSFFFCNTNPSDFYSLVTWKLHFFPHNCQYLTNCIPKNKYYEVNLNSDTKKQGMERGEGLQQEVRGGVICH